jgi:phospholipid/cholesterol/gamma-HCH transport system substrate-binding protein
LGEQYVGLEAGGDEESLKNGDKIAKTQDAVVLEKMISQFLFSKASETKSDANVSTPAAQSDIKPAGAKSTELGDPPF